MSALGETSKTSPPQLLAMCLRGDCDWTLRGPADDVEREARRHSGELAGGPGHPTVTSQAKSS